MQQNIISLFSLMSLGLISSIILTSKADAAGGSQESIPSSATSSNSNSVVTTNWKNWSETYWFNGNICRDSNANTICLAPQQAKENHWSIPTETTRK